MKGPTMDGSGISNGGIQIPRSESLSKHFAIFMAADKELFEAREALHLLVDSTQVAKERLDKAEQEWEANIQHLAQMALQEAPPQVQERVAKERQIVAQVQQQQGQQVQVTYAPGDSKLASTPVNQQTRW